MGFWELGEKSHLVSGSYRKLENILWELGIKQKRLGVYTSEAEENILGSWGGRPFVFQGAGS